MAGSRPVRAVTPAPSQASCTSSLSFASPATATGWSRVAASCTTTGPCIVRETFAFVEVHRVDRAPLPARPASWSVVVLLAALLVAGCGIDVASGSPAASGSPVPTAAGSGGPAISGLDQVELTVFADASLTDVMAAVKPAYEAATPGVTLSLTYGASNTLRGRIEQGDPADLFLSADVDNPAALVDGGLTQGPEQTFAANTLALVAPRGSAKVNRTLDLAKAGVHLAAAGKEDPISIYAAGLVEALGKVKGFPAGYAAGVAKNVASREADVRAVLARVANAEADAAFVYATDVAAGGDAVRAIKLPESLNPTTAYAGVVVRTTPNSDAASAFLAWLSSDAGQAVLTQGGLQPPAQ